MLPIRFGPWLHVEKVTHEDCPKQVYIDFHFPFRGFEFLYLRVAFYTGTDFKGDIEIEFAWGWKLSQERILYKQYNKSWQRCWK